jgi:hypothetical protein
MQVGELGHAPVSLSLRARLIQRKSINRFSTGSVTRAVLLALASVTAGCAGGEPGTTPSSDRVLTGDPASIKIIPDGTGIVRFVLTSGNVPIAGQTVDFTIFDDPGVPGVEAQGATTHPRSAVTDVSGAATVEVRAGLLTRFYVLGDAGGAQARVKVDVVAGPVGSLVVVPFFAPDSVAAADPEKTGISTIRVRFFDRHHCRDYPAAHVPKPPLNAELPASAATVRFDNVSTIDPSAVYAQALGPEGTPVAVGCVDVPGASVPANGVVEVALPMYDVAPDPIGTFGLTSTFDFEPPLAIAAVVAAPWRDISDCPLDPAELLLDCTIDALSPPTPGDPHDCKPGVGSEGPLGDALQARRGEEIPGTGCRGPFVGNAVSLDSIVLGMFGTPKPALIAALPAISADAAHVLDAPVLISTLSVHAGVQANQYLITHTLTDARFTLGGRTADVLLLPLALPNLTAHTAAITRDGLLVIDRHGFTLRLGRVARSGFGAAALAPRVPPGSPATAGGLVASIVALASTSDNAVSGCAALDRVLCADVGAEPGCLAAACPTGLSVLATTLDSAFDAADGAGFDLYLSGSAPLVDMSDEGWADLLPDEDDDHPAGIASWSADVRTSLGVTRIATSFKGVRQ